VVKGFEYRILINENQMARWQNGKMAKECNTVKLERRKLTSYLRISE
jgi:hypothetical protein